MPRHHCLSAFLENMSVTVSKKTRNAWNWHNTSASLYVAWYKIAANKHNCYTGRQDFCWIHPIVVQHIQTDIHTATTHNSVLLVLSIYVACCIMQTILRHWNTQLQNPKWNHIRILNLWDLTYCASHYHLYAAFKYEYFKYQAYVVSLLYVLLLLMYLWAIVTFLKINRW
jgi:hypothetical protein